MKKKLHFGILLFLIVGFSTLSYAQTPKTVCQITANPINNDYVITQGHVQSVSGDDDFYITSGGCTIKCDGQTGNLPIVGMSVAVQGRVEDDDKKSSRDELEIDVEYWVEEGGTTPPPPTEEVLTVAEALAANPGTIALLDGTVTSWTDENDGEGIFADNSGSIAIDFESGNKPGLTEEVIVLGTVDYEDNTKEIDVYYWYPVGGTPPAPSEDIAWTVQEANAAPNGTYAIVPGAVSSWTNMNDGEGIYEDESASINIDFEDGVPNPNLSEQIYVLGIIDTENNTKEIEAYGWVEYSGVGLTEQNRSDLRIYPNPVSNYLYVDYEGSLTDISIIDLTGRTVLQEKSLSKSRIDVSGLPKGIYILSILRNNQIMTTKKVSVR